MIPVADALVFTCQEARPLASDVRTLPRPGDQPWIWMVQARRVFHETESVLWRDVAPVTVSVFLRVEAPTTPRVQPRTVAHETQRVDERVVAHATPRVHWTVVFPVVRRVPLRSRL